ncbi:MAG TPA: anti-sigma factor [Nocardioidaceae bacterium]|nr:anti-sigma factor [Nocardioidaceae bacterium]
MNDDERIAYLAGESSAPVDPAERARLDKRRAVLADPAVWAEPPPDLQERIVGAIASAGEGRPDTAPDLEPSGSTADRDNVVQLRTRWTRYAILGAAAAVLVAVGFAIGLTNQGSEPVEYAASLRGTDLAPDASGQVTLTQTDGGWEIHLQAEGLPRRDDRGYYEAWLKNDAGILVPIGTFNQPDDVTLWAGVPPSSYPTLTVTRQLANGNPASSGQVVLEGTTHPDE